MTEIAKASRGVKKRSGRRLRLGLGLVVGLAAAAVWIRYLVQQPALDRLTMDRLGLPGHGPEVVA